MAQHCDSIGNIHCPVIIGICGVEAGWRRTVGEDVTESEDGISDVEGVVGVGVAAAEVYVRERLNLGPARARCGFWRR
jgi:hypothetical protein